MLCDCVQGGGRFDAYENTVLVLSLLKENILYVTLISKGGELCEEKNKYSCQISQKGGRTDA